MTTPTPISLKFQWSFTLKIDIDTHVDINKHI